MPLTFDVLVRDPRSQARLGRLGTPHGVIDTPVFMPVGTQATVKALRSSDLLDCGASIILGNTYHLYLRPGHELIRSLGGLHEFMGWRLPILTDSGGFQVFSLGNLARVSEDGVTFQSHIDGSRHLLTPERAIDIQLALGSDVMMAFDECTPLPRHIRRRAAIHGVDRTLGATLPRRRCQARRRAFRHRAGQRLQGTTGHQRQGTAGHRLRRLCHRRPQRRRGAFGHVRHGGPHGPAVARASAALSDGRRQAAGHPARRAPGHRHVRLRFADP